MVDWRRCEDVFERLFVVDRRVELDCDGLIADIAPIPPSTYMFESNAQPVWLNIGPFVRPR